MGLISTPISSMKKYQNHNLALLWSAQAISQSGDAIYQLALIWLVLDMTNSSIITGIVAMSAYLPALIFGLYAGVFSDRLNRLRLMIFANAGQALTVLLIPLFLWFGYENVWIICGLAFLRSCFNTLFQPALNSIVPMLFSKDHLVKINAILATSGQLAWMMGPFFAGILLTMVSLPNLFLVDSGSFLIGISLLLFIKKPKNPDQVENHSHWDNLKQGLLYLFREKPIFWMMIITFINNFYKKKHPKGAFLKKTLKLESVCYTSTYISAKCAVISLLIERITVSTIFQWHLVFNISDTNICINIS